MDSREREPGVIGVDTKPNDLLATLSYIHHKGWDPMNRFDPATFLCLSYAVPTWISNVMYRNLFLKMFSDLRLEVIVRFVVIGRIVDHHCLNFSYHNHMEKNIPPTQIDLHVKKYI